MQSIELQGQLRPTIGKTESKLTRVSGSIPCVLYGGTENVHFTIDEIAFSKVYITPIVYVVHLVIDGKTYKAIIKNIQFHPVTDKALHVDFYEIFDNKPFSIKLPVNIIGVSEGVKQGGKLQLKMRKIKVKGLLKDLPEVLDVDITKLGIGQSVKMDSLNYSNLTIEESKSAVVCSVNLTRSAARAMQQEGGKK
ncbi:MAG TPA: 50S ribosomal protein L25/general stress protein Ctc [Bacteroidales bacterium]|nr:MAG: 50S ribosomal protein L25 [Bacteroidetes bacterium ADurb.Bin217]HPM13437.1 50S ribosomal protein L25/general stress protein Ctc [Bacteroidales bacterium]